jgi:uncharacterized repeat protein (TIGR01451 family)
VERLEARQLLASISDSGGVGGTSKSLSLTADLNLVTFRWENFSIPDEFQILQSGRRIAGDVGLQSSGNSGTTIVSARSSGGQQTSNQLQIKVTAPREGTAWNFAVSAEPVGLIAEAKLGDVTGISIDDLFMKASRGTTLSGLGFDMTSLEIVNMSNAKGKVAEVDDWKGVLQSKGVFYFVPTVNGTPLNYGETNRTDPGVGESQLFVRGTVNPPFSSDGPRQVEFPIKIVVTNGFSTSFADPGLMRTVPAVEGAGKTKLDIYRQEQRLAYLGYPQESGTPLLVDGVASTGETDWARKLFSIAIDPSLNRGQLPNPISGIKYFKDFINDSQAPYWRDLRVGINGLSFPSSINENLRFYGPDNAGRMIVQANQSPLISSGAARKTGKGTPSKSHDGGRGFDLIPWFGSGQYFFDELTTTSGTRFVAANAAAGGGFIYRNISGAWQGGGQLNNPSHITNGLRVTELVKDTSSDRTKQLRNLLKYRQEESVVQTLLTSFISAGSPRIFYNDPRFFTEGGNIQYQTSGAYNHFNHIHFVVPGGVGTTAQMAQRFTGTSLGASEAPSTLTVNRLGIAIPLGSINGTVTQSGLLNAPNEEILYQFQVGDEIDDDAVFPNLPRNLSVALSGLSGDVDIELLTDSTGEGFGEVYATSSSTSTTGDNLGISDLPSGVYYLRIFTKASDTAFNLDITVPPLPIPPDAAGNDLAGALNFGNFSEQTKIVTDFIGEVDGDDFYRFTLASISDLNLTLSGLDKGDVEVSLGRKLTPSDTTLNYIGTSNEEGNAAESIEAKLLPTGEYFIRVSRVSGNTNYQLRLSANTTAVPADKAGDTIVKSFDLGSIASIVSVSDFIGSIDPVDLYRFTVSNALGLKARLTGLSGDADLEIFRDLDGNGVLDATEQVANSILSGVSDEEIILQGVAPETYFVRVAQFEGDTDYTLVVSSQAASGADLVVTRTDTISAADLGTEFTYSVRVSNNGPDVANNIRLTETLPIGLERVRVTKSIPGGSIQNTSTGFIGLVPTLSSGSSVTFDVTVTSYIAGSLATATTVTSNTPDYELINNRLVDLKRVASIVSPPADIELSMTATNLEPKIDETVAFTIRVKNSGPGTSTDIKVNSLLPSGLRFISATPAPGSIYDTTSGIWTVGNIRPNDSVQLVINAVVTSGASLTLVSEVTNAAESDPDSSPGNNAPGEDDYASITLNARPTGLSLISDSLKVGINRIEVINAIPGGVINLVRGTGAGQTTLDGFGITLDISDGMIVAQGVVQPDGKAIMIVDIWNTGELNTAVFQAFEHGTNSRKTNVLTKEGSISIAANSASTQSGIISFSSLSRQNFVSVFDINTDSFVSPIDALIVINHLNQRTSEGEFVPNGSTDGSQIKFDYRLDVNDDGYVSPLDVLMVIDELNWRSTSSGEGEGTLLSAISQTGSESNFISPLDDELLSVLAIDATQTWQRPYQGKKRR